MDESELVRKLAESKVVGQSGKALDSMGEAAVALLADLSAVGLAHGITPDDWTWVMALPNACCDVCQVAAGRHQTAVDGTLSVSVDYRVIPPVPVCETCQEGFTAAGARNRMPPRSQRSSRGRATDTEPSRAIDGRPSARPGPRRAWSEVTTLTPERWLRRALCVTRPINPDWFHPGERTRRSHIDAAFALCALCAVRKDCLQNAMDNNDPWGIWGGTTQEQCAVLLGAHHYRPATQYGR